MQIPTRKIVYILGAGFSAGTKHTAQRGTANIPMPLQNDLLQRIFQYHFRRIRNLDHLAQTIRKYFCPTTYRSHRQDGANRHSDINHLSVEEIVTFLEEMARDLEEPKAKHFRKTEKQLRELTVELIAFLSINGNPGKNQYLKKFRERLSTTDTIISFNWDTLLDRVLFDGKTWHPAWGYGRSVGDLFHYCARVTPRPPKKHITMLKLHGSVNWLAEGKEFRIPQGFSPQDFELGQVVMMPPKMLKQEIWGDKPTEETSQPLRGNWAVHKQALYPKIWKEAERHLQRAKRIVFIGYSFPPADFSVYGLLRRALATSKIAHRGQPRIQIIDPNASLLAERFLRSFRIKVDLQDQFLSLASYVSQWNRN